MTRGMAIAGWTAAGLAGALHLEAWRSGALGAPQLGGLTLAFGLASVALLGLVLVAQREAAAGRGLGLQLGERLPRAGRWGLGLGFAYVGLHLLGGLPVGGGGEGFHFDRAFTALLAWFGLAAALFHQGGRR
ncbi:MAG: hypothetical protein VKQ33_01270 [Candidatus Sericytochromatia bacterium]|nr:hypothetical protein [Candidatus Sericytochromatia bacterium]